MTTGQDVIAGAWNGSPTVLLHEVLYVVQTPNGSTVFTATNQSANSSQIVVETGTNQVVALNPPGLVAMNWQGTYLNISNVYEGADAPCLVQLVGPGIPGITAVDIPIGLPGVALASGQIAQANATGSMQVVITAITAAVGVVAIIGGPVDSTGNNVYVIGVNWPEGVMQPAGYYAVTAGYNYAFPFNWGANAPLFTAVISPTTTTAINVMLLAEPAP